MNLPLPFFYYADNPTEIVNAEVIFVYMLEVYKEKLEKINKKELE